MTGLKKTARRSRKRRQRTLGAFAAGHGRQGAIFRFFTERVRQAIARGLKPREARVMAGPATAKKFRCHIRTVQRAVTEIAGARSEAAPVLADVAASMDDGARQYEFIRAQLTAAELDAMTDLPLPAAYAGSYAPGERPEVFREAQGPSGDE